MDKIANKKVLVVGLGASGVAAARLLRRLNASVCAIDAERSESLEAVAETLGSAGVAVRLGVRGAEEGEYDFVVLRPGVPLASPMLRKTLQRKTRIISEFELGCQYSRCPSVAITGTNGKTTTTELVERMLNHADRPTVSAGNIGTPVCEVVERSRELDFLALEVSSFQLETIESFRPTVGVLLNITPDHLDRHGSMDAYVRAKALLFKNQQVFDWAVIQEGALARLRALDLPVPSKVITFGADSPKADIYFDRGLIISRIPGWTGPLLDLETCELRGVHNAENLMAALAVGHILGVSLSLMAGALRSYQPAPHRCELVAEIDGVRFVNDSKATNIDALEKAVLAMPAGAMGEPNIFLIAGGKEKGLQYHDAGPLLARRVKRVFLLGEARETIRAAWSLFTPCSVVNSLLEAVSEAVRSTRSGDVVLLSPGCSSFDMFQNYRHRGELFRQAVLEVTGGSRRPSSATCISSPVKSGGRSRRTAGAAVKKTSSRARSRSGLAGASSESLPQPSQSLS